jgi:hypothetical protein
VYVTIRLSFSLPPPLISLDSPPLDDRIFSPNASGDEFAGDALPAQEDNKMNIREMPMFMADLIIKMPLSLKLYTNIPLFSIIQMR